MATRRTPPAEAPDQPDATVVDLASHRADAAAAAAALAPPRAVIEIPLEHIEPDAANVRTKLRDLDGLAKSITALGVLEPCLVHAIGPDRYRLLAGHRRRAATELAGLPTLPCLVNVDDLTDTDRLQVQLVENLQRDDLTPLEEALGYQALVDAGDTQRKIAETVGRNQSHISKRLKLLTLPDKARAALDAGELTVDDALTLTELAGHPEHVAEAMAEYAKELEWNGPYPGLMASCVTEQTRAIEREQARAAMFEELTAAGIRVIDWPKNGYGGPWPTGYRRMDVHHQWPEHKPPTKARVQKGGHLAAAVDATGVAVYLCTDPVRYEAKRRDGATTGDRRADDAKAEAARTRALNKRRRAEAKARQAVAGRFVRNAADKDARDRHLDDAIGGHRSLGEPTSIFVRSILDTWLDLIGNVWAEPTKIALELLDIDPAQRGWGVLQRLEAEPEYSGRVELAVWIAFAEDRILRHQLIDPLVTAYYRWISTQGYQPTADEQHELAEALGQAKAS